MKLSFSLLPAYYSLVQCTYDIAETHGDAAALGWFNKTLKSNSDLFISCERIPELRLIQGGAA